MVKVNSNGLMEEYMKVNIKMIKKMDMVFFIGLTEEYIKEIGKMENKMEKGNFLILKKKNGKKVYGKKEKELNGSVDGRYLIFFYNYNFFGKYIYYI